MQFTVSTDTESDAIGVAIFEGLALPQGAPPLDRAFLESRDAFLRWQHLLPVSGGGSRRRIRAQARPL